MMKRILLIVLLPLMFFMGMQIGNNAQAQMTTVPIGDGTATSSDLPFNMYYKKSFNQMVYYQREIGRSGYIGAISFDKSGTTSRTVQELTIWMAKTSDSVMTRTSWIPQSSMTQVFHATNFTIPASEGTLLLALDAPFYYDGTQNLAIIVSRKDDTKTSAISFKYTQQTNVNCMFRRNDFQDAYASHPGTAPASGTSNHRPNVKLYMNNVNSFCFPLSQMNVTDITESTIAVSWPRATGTNSYEVAILENNNGNADITTAPTIVVSDTHYTFSSSLLPNTPYLIGVRKFCKGNTYSEWITQNVITTTLPISLPFSCDFETEESYENIVFDNGTLLNHWVVDTAVRYDGESNHSMYITDSATGKHNNSYDNSKRAVVYAKSLIKFTEQGEHNISYDWLCNGQTTYDYMRVAIIPANKMEDIVAGTDLPRNLSATSLPSGMIAADGGSKLNAETSWQHFAGVIDIPTAGNYYLVYIWRNDGNGGTNPAAAVDNIVVERTTCLGIDTVELDASATSATMTVRSASSHFKFYYRVLGSELYDTMEVDSPFTLTDLQPGTFYECIIRSSCADGDSYSTYSFQFGTDCAELSLPWRFGAESSWIKHETGNESFPYCWENVNAKSLYYYWRNDKQSHSGSNSIFFSGAYSTTEMHNDWLMTPKITFTGNEEMSFFVKTTSSQASYIGRFTLYASTDALTSITDTAHYEALTLTGTSVVDNYVTFHGDTWQQITVKLPATLTGSHHLAFVVKNQASGSFYIDNLSLYTISSCPTPSNIQIKSLTSTSAVVSCASDAPTLKFYYGAPGFIRSEADSIVADTNVVTLDNLTPLTTYAVEVVATCSDGVISNPSYPITFTTACSPIALENLPLYEDFSDNQVGHNTSNFDACWIVGTNGTTPTPSIEAQGYLSANSIRLKNSTTFYSYVALPSVEDELSNMVIAGDLMEKKIYPNMPDNAHVILGVMSNPNDVATFTAIDTLYASAINTWTDFQVPLTSVDAEMGQYVAFMLPISNEIGDVYLDNLLLAQRATCDAPMHLTINSIDESSVNVGWTDTEGSSWTVYYGAPGFNPDTVSSPVVSSENNATITNLNSKTTYELLVRTNCAEGEESIISSRIQFTTTCNRISELPYTEDFETYRNYGEIDSCWTRHTFGNTYTYAYPTNIAAINGSLGLYMKAGVMSYQPFFSYLSLPSFEDAISSLRVSFNMMKKKSTGYNTPAYTKLTVGVMSNPNDISTFDTVEVVDMGVDSIGTKKSYEVSFANYEGEGQYIAFMAGSIEDQTNFINEIYLDDISVSLLPICQTPTNLVQTANSASTIDLAWQGDALSYEVKYSTHADMSDSVVVSTTDNHYQLTGLDAYTDYYITVRGLCDENLASSWSTPILNVRTSIDCGEGYRLLIDTIGHGTYASPEYTLHTKPSASRATTWTIITKEELDQMGFIGDNNIIKSLSLEAGTSGSAVTFKVYMKEIGINEFSYSHPDTIPVGQMSLVYDGTMTFESNAWNEIMLTSPFIYKDTSNLMIAFVRDSAVAVATNFKYSAQSNNVTYYIYGDANRMNGLRTTSRGNMILKVCGDIPTCIRPMNLVSTDIVSDAITLSWEGSAANYEIAYDVVDFDPNQNGSQQTLQVAGSTATTIQNATISSLQATQTYYIYVRSLCGNNDNSLWSNIVLTTPCNPYDLPYAEDFDSYEGGNYAGAGQTINPCWVKGTNNRYQKYPYIHANMGASAPNAMEFHGDATSYSYAALPMLNNAINATSMVFRLKQISNTATMFVGVMSDPHDVATFTQVAQLSTSTRGVWENFEVDFATYSGAGRYIAFMVNAFGDMQLDDIEVFATPTCKSPLQVVVSDITSNSAKVTWTDREITVSGHELEYGPVGFVLGEGTRISATTNPTTLTNLIPGTDYEVYVRALCADNDEGRWSFATTFFTECGPMPLPLFYDFEPVVAGSRVDLPHCVIRHNDASHPGYKGYPYLTNNVNYAHSGNYMLYYKADTVSNSAHAMAIVTPEIDVVNHPINGTQLSFWGKRGNAASQVIVGAISNPTDFATFTAIDTITLDSLYTNYVVSFANYQGTATRMAIQMERATAIQEAYIDDIMVEDIPSCPRVFNLQVVGVSATTATVAWTDTIGSSRWIVDYRTASSHDIQSVEVTSNPYTLTNLTANTQYLFNVRPICASGDTSVAVHGDKSFFTSQVAAILPYNYDFEDATEWANWQTNSNCNVNWYRGTAVASQGSQALYISNNQGNTHATDWNRYVNAVTYRDIDFGSDTASFSITFKAKAGGLEGQSVDGLSLLMVNPADEVVASSRHMTSPWGVASDIALTTIHLDTTWNEYTVYLDHISGVQRIAFYWYNSNLGEGHRYMNQPGAIDSISIVEQTCARPYALQASAITSTSATLSWSGNATSYELAYGIIGQPLSTTTQIINGTTANIASLRSISTYECKVRSICGEGDTSAWSSAITFLTECGLYVAEDTLREDFNQVPAVHFSSEGNVPNCWDAYVEGAYGKAPHVVNSGQMWYARSGNALVMTAGGSAYGNMSGVRLPYTLEPVHTLSLSFWMCTETNRRGTLQVGYLTGSDIATDFVIVDSVHASDATQHTDRVGVQPAESGIRDTFYFRNAPEEAQALALRWVCQGEPYTAISIDDVVMVATITCHTPVITNTTTESESATLTWNSTAASYQLLYKEASATDWSDTLTTTENSYTFNDLTPETEYHVMLRAICGNDDGNSMWTTTSFSTAMAPCNKPTVTVNEVTREGVRLTWTSEENHSAWEVNVFNTIVNETYEAQQSSYTLTQLEHATTYRVAVRALCAENVYSDWSDTVQFTTLDCLPVSNVVVSDITKNSAVITWTVGGEESLWQINYGEEGFAQGEGQIQTVNATNYTLTELAPETSYEVYVRAICGEDFNSTWSTPVCRFQTLTDGSEGIDGVKGNFQFVIYPNPTTNSTTISLNGVEGKVMISVVDMNGRTVANETIECGVDCEKRIDVTQLSQGTYFVRVLGDNLNSVRKLIVR